MNPLTGSFSPHVPYICSFAHLTTVAAVKSIPHKFMKLRLAGAGLTRDRWAAVGKCVMHMDVFVYLMMPMYTHSTENALNVAMSTESWLVQHLLLINIHIIRTTA